MEVQSYEMPFNTDPGNPKQFFKTQTNHRAFWRNEQGTGTIKGIAKLSDEITGLGF